MESQKLRLKPLNGTTIQMNKRRGLCIVIVYVKITI